MTTDLIKRRSDTERHERIGQGKSRQNLGLCHQGAKNMGSCCKPEKAKKGSSLELSEGELTP